MLFQLVVFKHLMPEISESPGRSIELLTALCYSIKVSIQASYCSKFTMKQFTDLQINYKLEAFKNINRSLVKISNVKIISNIKGQF